MAIGRWPTQLRCAKSLRHCSTLPVHDLRSGFPHSHISQERLGLLQDDSRPPGKIHSDHAQRVSGRHVPSLLVTQRTPPKHMSKSTFSPRDVFSHRVLLMRYLSYQELILRDDRRWCASRRKGVHGSFYHGWLRPTSVSKLYGLGAGHTPATNVQTRSVLLTIPGKFGADPCNNLEVTREWPLLFDVQFACGTLRHTAVHSVVNVALCLQRTCWPWMRHEWVLFGGP
jgi:hypothetical protein